jgi:pimeloyl-ACP methyl ester carboxylesterase
MWFMKRDNSVRVLLAYMKNLAFLVFLIAISYSGNCQTIAKPHHIHSLEKVKLGGLSQTILITGEDTTKPVLLFLHGGPAFSEMALVRKYNRDLDKYFVVVNWDQRGTNLSYDPSIPTSSMTIERIVDDAKELIGLLKKKFHRNKIFLLGHSWGSAIGIMLANKYPRDLYAYIGVGQVANMQDNEKVSLAYALRMAEKAHNIKAVAELKAILPYPSPNSTLSQLYTSRKWMDYYGGEVYKKHGPEELFDGIANGKNQLYDLKKSDAGLKLSMEMLWAPFMKIDLPHSVPELKIPVYFLLGKYDFNVPYTLAVSYLQKLKAPVKKIVLFNNSAHFIPFEEPRKFVKVMAQIASTVQ